MGSNEGARGRSDQFAYLDLLATTLTEHEKNLDKLIRRLEKISRDLSTIVETMKSDEPASVRSSSKEEKPETLVYMRLKVNRPADELKAILDSLKE